MSFKALCSVLLLSMISFTSPAHATGSQDERLVIADEDGDRGLLAPFLHQKNGPAYLYTSYVFDTLLDQDREGRVVPGLARKWTVSNNGRTIDLELDERARWHDGQPVTGEDIIFTFDYMKKHPYAFATVDDVVGVTILADRHVRLELKDSGASFANTTLVALPILPAHVYRDQPVPEKFSDMRAAIGSGPYKLMRYDKAQGRYLLERNDDYYRGIPKFEQIAIVRMSAQAALNARGSGDVDVIATLPYEFTQDAKAKGWKILTSPSNHPLKLVLNHKGPLGDALTRQALAHAIDRQKLVDLVYHGGANVAQPGYFQNGSPWRDSAGDAAYDFSPDKAAPLLAARGWSRGDQGQWSKDSEKVRLRLLADKGNAKAATVLSEQLHDFGLEVDFRLMERAALQQAAQSGDFDMMLASSSTMGDPNGIARRVFGTSLGNDQFPRKGALADILQRQKNATSNSERLALLHELQKLYARELPSLLLVNPLWAVAYDDKIDPVFLPDGIAIGIPMALPRTVLMSQ